MDSLANYQIYFIQAKNSHLSPPPLPPPPPPPRLHGPKPKPKLQSAGPNPVFWWLLPTAQLFHHGRGPLPRQPYHNGKNQYK